MGPLVTLACLVIVLSVICTQQLLCSSCMCIAVWHLHSVIIEMDVKDRSQLASTDREGPFMTLNEVDLF